MDETFLSKLEEGGNKEYESKEIWDNKVYIKKSDSSHLPDLYYLIS